MKIKKFKINLIKKLINQINQKIIMNNNYKMNNCYNSKKRVNFNK